MRDVVGAISFIASGVLLLAALLSLMAPRLFILKWATLTTKRRLYGSAFYFSLSVCFFSLCVACILQSIISLIIATICAYVAYTMWLPLRTGIIPSHQIANKSLKTDNVKKRPEPKPINVPFQQEADKGQTSQILTADCPEIKKTPRKQASLARAEENYVRVRFGHIFTNNNIFDVPKDVAELLWFKNGPLKNFDVDSVGSNHDIGGGFSVHIYMNSQIEPSVIDVNMPVKTPKNRLFIGALNYFPTYLSLDEEQKWCYWNWLCNVDEITDIGYVFIFYYGLERHLYFGKYKQAANMISRLRRYHTNASFQSYSEQALLAAALYHKDSDIYKMVFTETPNHSDLGLFVRFFSNIPLSASELMSLCADFGFTNKRYIKEHTEMFLEILTRRMTERFGSPFLPFSLIDIQTCPLTTVNIVANISLEPRTINISNITQSPAYKQAGYDLLSSTHEELKQTLKEMRKRGEI